LFELESALSGIGLRDCNDLQDTTQLSAAIYCLLRATSLFRATLSLVNAGLMDASDVMRRAYWEAWMLGYEFRIESAADHAAAWHRDKDAKVFRDSPLLEHSNNHTESPYLHTVQPMAG